MREAVIVSTARTPLTKAHRGEFNNTQGPQLGAFSVEAAVQRAGIEHDLIEDLIWGCGHPEGTTGRNIGRQTVLRAGLPVTVGGTVINRFCSSSLQAIAVAAGRIVLEGVPAIIGRRRREHFAHASGRSQRYYRDGSLAAQAQARAVHGDDRHR